ncbi:maltose ABC transporter substrate-binding protein MalE [Actinobacillus succinogenes]|uniref:Maltodextrin-binding protein n=1 Tax=Actinobacillus succinogenes (strain ATCC 55618 / DSM 22257 / CCUG 43843 / 130Z) TaxID=339671 RepID=A6VL50_ACTSZ|nr:maltose/maltodextrin ABC transporter substrate-binding protein MalE [Actinobacillus succinogenes]ABR73697.1 extracellular solute-binding protein family 1 [Actinobacillus succinogenes 130Z]PHI39845.1 maltose ABC transporter substrate-binding protein MalE [Actinobacillus succinogenes]
MKLNSKSKTLFYTLLSGSIIFFSFSAWAKFEEGKLVVWGGGKGHPVIAQIGEQFEKDTGIAVKVENPGKLEEDYAQLASNGAGPDIIIYAHDRFGGYAKAGLLAELTPSKEFKDKFSGFAWDAETYEGKIIGYPMAIEALSLIYNKALVQTPPKTWEELKVLDDELRKKGKNAIVWNISEPYFTWPVLAADGGYAFKINQGKYDISDIGVNNPGAKKALQFVVDFVNSDHIRADTDYAIAEAGFIRGDTAMIINGPWAWVNLDKAEMNYGVTALPTFNGKPSKPFVGIISIGINASSPNKDLAKEFIENYLLTDESLEIINKTNTLGAVPLLSLQAKLASDPRVAATMENAKNGEIMPNIPQMTSFWYSMKSAINNAITGRETASQALDNAEQRIRSGINK